MTDRYVGPGGNDGSDGLSWANRKLTLNGVEDTPVVAGDTVYVGPGVYREILTIDVVGTSGAVITYIGDVTGENTDSVGGVVRTSGSDNDTSSTRADSIVATSGENYRTFRGFQFDGHSANAIEATDTTNWIVEDCVFLKEINASLGINILGASQAAWTIRRCLFYGRGMSIYFAHSSTVSNAGHLVENCINIGDGNQYFVRDDRVGGITIKNCTVQATSFGIRVQQNLATGQTVTVNNCILSNCNAGVRALVTGEITEDYNNFSNNSTDRTNVTAGGNSIDQMVLPDIAPLLDGLILPTRMQGALMPASSSARIAGTGESTEDLYGVVRPTTSAKKSWGAVQLREAERETGTVQTGSAALTLADAGDHQVYVPVTATSTTFEVAARYESEYAGTLPRLIVRQPGQADQVDTMVAAADTWETLSLTFTPNATPPYVVIILRSLNTSVTGDFDTYWDDLDVS